MLYNGTEPYADEKTLKLPDAFETASSLGLPEKESPALKLAVKVIHINHGKNEALVKRCKTLTEYSVRNLQTSPIHRYRISLVTNTKSA